MPNSRKKQSHTWQGDQKKSEFLFANSISPSGLFPTSSTRTTEFPVRLQAVVVLLLHPWMSRIFSAHTYKRR